MLTDGVGEALRLIQGDDQGERLARIDAESGNVERTAHPATLAIMRRLSLLLVPQT